MAEEPISLEDHSPITPAIDTDSEEKSSPTENIDILYENQRGAFCCGIPLFSANSLLNFDPKPWVTSTYKPSPVNITNAQLPDPSWEWTWKSWYVDMSHDVDEEGWEYSYWFRGFSWHGSHPWFHSFVRRRRWLRKRNKKKQRTRKDLEDAQPLRKDAASIGTTLVPSNFVMNTRQPSVDEGQREEITNVLALMAALKKSPIDREKIVVVKQFLSQGGEELHYLAENIPAIMAQLVFQDSRRQLLATLTAELDAAGEHREEHKNRKQPEDEIESRRIDNLLKAANTADEQCRKLEYWSDIRGMVREGEAKGATDAAHGWDGHGWQGVDSSGPPPGRDEQLREKD
ncbi:hypothetical protein EJ05DRAFT_511446 [Pseudovirgaria hyperparasitica]|uniref:Peroxin/Ferlin domain-containing protein n=1 Tax=Pseudovirgaria hyperparasitica TaxID=470096 RepID=A0A6A6W9B1_9PEZI|nr:uncharacterized protein EJ05DRAFT_511446 [Pseudovirgaria hyperparasitica]KAF2757671.1 hypothetical protein EJ05DRAFT_511446 [Pseudovirgaria hyperparasitica]